MVRISIEDAIKLYHNRHETMEVVNRERKKLAVSYSFAEDGEYTAVKVQCDEAITISSTRETPIISWYQIYKVPLSKSQKEEFVAKYAPDNEYSCVDIFLDIRDRIYNDECEEYLKSESEVDVLYIG